MLLPPLFGRSLVKMKVTRNARVYQHAVTNENQLDLNPFNGKLALLSGSFLISLIRLSTVIQCSTLCTQRKVTKFPCFCCLVFGAQFQHFWNFFAHFFAMQLALVSMITVTLISSLSVFSLQRTRRFRTRGE